MTRKVKNFSEEWLFHLGDISNGQDPELDDERWRVLDLPHDWSIEGRFIQYRDEYWYAFRNLDSRIGYLPQGIGWYRKHFFIPDEPEKKIFIQFDGVYRESKVWLNGNFLGFRPYGYSSFWYDLTPFVNFGGENVIAVKVDNTGCSSRWYAGSGIYRNVYLITTRKIHFAHWGVYWTTPEVDEKRAKLNVMANVINETDQNIISVSLRTQVIDNNEIVAENTTHENLGPGMTEICHELTIKEPKLWDIENPNLYEIKCTIIINNEEIDDYQIPLGIRWFEFTQDNGFFLNGKPVKIKGVCLHHDNGPLGAKVFKRAEERKLQIMKEMGCNAIRTSHNPPSQELLDACDRLGFLVMDELFDEWTIPKTPMGYTRWFNKPIFEGSNIRWYEKDVMDFVHRDRNHPSVIIWSCGNEVPEQNSAFGDKGVKVLKKLLDVFHREDPTRPVTQGCNQMEEANKTGFADMLDIVGYNYYGDRVVGPGKEGFTCMYDKEHEKYPTRIMIGSENCSALNTRGVYEYPVPMMGLRINKKRENFQMSSYDLTSEYPLIILKTRPYVSGYFTWTGFDYIGEPTPYPWPAKSSYFGLVDLCGFPKDNYYLHQSMWTDPVKDGPMVHLVPNMWNFHDGDIIEVWAYTNCESVELFLNGRSLGEKRMDEYDDLAHVFWENVKYEPGELKAVAKIKDKIAATRTVKTSGFPHHLSLKADRPEILANGEDLVYLTVTANDIDDNVVPTAENLITFTVEGPGEIIAVGNGNPISHEPFCDQQRHLFMGYALGILKSLKNKRGYITVHVNAPMLKPAEVQIKAI
ncbi:MAG: glycoside hydrolase family 2 TIM barrel-domain containing protein [Promethearchaeota archaeon]